MSDTLHTVALIAVMALVTMVLRFLPFWLFPAGKKTPAFILYLGRVLPCAVMGMLAVYCYKNIMPFTWPHGLPELIAGKISPEEFTEMEDESIRRFLEEQ